MALFHKLNDEYNKPRTKQNCIIATLAVRIVSPGFGQPKLPGSMLAEEGQISNIDILYIYGILNSSKQRLFVKTSVELDEKKVALAKKLTDTDTIKETLDKALDALISQQRRLSMLDILGTPFYSGSLKKMRADRRGSSR
jgi:hypothetical protein